MPVYRPNIPPHAAVVIRHFPPDLKASVKSALRCLSRDPRAGTPLAGELEGYWKYRVRRFRIVYTIDIRGKTLRVMAVGHRREIYDEAVRMVHERKRSEG